MKLSTKGRYAMVAMADIALSAQRKFGHLGRNFKETKYFNAIFRTVICKTSKV